MTTKLSVDAVLAAAKAVSKKHPGPAKPTERWDLFYGNGQPRCFVGHVLYELGYKAKDLVATADGEKVRLMGLAGLEADEVLQLFPDAEAVALAMLAESEAHNDNGMPWKEIYERCKDFL